MTAPAVRERLSTLDILAERGHFPEIERSNFKNAFGFRCPFHNDTRPSFWVTGDGELWHCWSCGGGGVTKLLQLFGDDYRAPPKPAPAQKKSKHKGTPFTGCTLAQLAEAKNLPIEYLRSLGWRDVAYGRVPAVAVPWPGGTHYRVNLVGEPKYLWDKGDKVSILGIERLEEIRRGGWVLFIEGETDYAAGLLLGLPVMAIPGASTFKKEWALQFQGCQIYAWREPGKGGETFTDKLAESFWGIKVIEPPDGIKDLCDLHDQAGEGAREFFQEIVAEAQSTRKKTIPKAVASTDITHKVDIRKRDRDQIRWDRANELWPPDYRVPHAGKYTVRMNKATFAVAFVKGYAHTWHHAENEKQKKRLIFFNVAPRMAIDDEVFWHEYHHEDFDDLKYKALKKQVERADGDHNMLCIDNVQGRGSYTCFASVQVEGWSRLNRDDVEAEFIKAIDHIRVPDDTSRFQPVKGTQRWVRKMTTPRIKDADQWDDIGYADGKDFDLVYVEAEARAEGIPCDETPVYKEWRKTGIGNMLVLYPSSLEEGLRFAASCGIKLKPRYKAMLEEALVAGGPYDNRGSPD